MIFEIETHSSLSDECLRLVTFMAALLARNQTSSQAAHATDSDLWSGGIVESSAPAFPGLSAPINVGSSRRVRSPSTQAAAALVLSSPTHIGSAVSSSCPSPNACPSPQEGGSASSRPASAGVRLRRGSRQGLSLVSPGGNAAHRGSLPDCAGATPHFGGFSNVASRGGSLPDAADASPHFGASPTAATGAGIGAFGGARLSIRPKTSGESHDRRLTRAVSIGATPDVRAAAVSTRTPRPDLTRGSSAVLSQVKSDMPAFENWRLDFHTGGGAAVRISEFANWRPVVKEDDTGRCEVYCRPTNKRDLGHRCYHCRKPFSSLGSDIVVDLQSGSSQRLAGPSQRYHPECWQRRCEGERPSNLRVPASSVPPAQDRLPQRADSTGDLRREETEGAAPAPPTPAAASPRQQATTEGAGQQIVGAEAVIGSADSAPVAAEPRGRTESDGNVQGRRTDIIASYADEWRRPSTEGRSSSRRAAARAASRQVSSTPALDTGLVSTEDASGEKRVARGFAAKELDAILPRLACRLARDTECAICFATDGKLRKPLRLPCEHVFCSECVAPWLQRCALCPMCRQDVRPALEAMASVASKSEKRSRSLAAVSTVRDDRRPPRPGTPVQRRNSRAPNAELPNDNGRQTNSRPGTPVRRNSRAPPELPNDPGRRHDRSPRTGPRGPRHASVPPRL
eukprot:TRINITY_DN11673_c0_g1_i1.p1 TRINITY_DN11673_c0_g1~~TRINITY_DN11673_c0_g1_i1.p1  ORF type:complete len:683 (-),score=15.53 TRINITY_DN11673_c0_g1_i1:296-2344(-)